MKKRKTRSEIANQIQKLLYNHAQAINILINDGLSFEDAMRNDLAKFWIKAITKAAEELEPQATETGEEIKTEDIPF